MWPKYKQKKLSAESSKNILTLMLTSLQANRHPHLVLHRAQILGLLVKQLLIANHNHTVNFLILALVNMVFINFIHADLYFLGWEGQVVCRIQRGRAPSSVGFGNPWSSRCGLQMGAITRELSKWEKPVSKRILFKCKFGFSWETTLTQTWYSIWTFFL